MGLANRLLMLACLAGCRCRPAGPSPCPFVDTLLTRHPIVRPPRSPHGPLDPCPAHLLAATSSAPPSLRARRALRALLGAQRGTDHVQACALYDAGACLPIGAAGVQGRRYHTRMATATSRAASAKHPGAFGVR